MSDKKEKLSALLLKLGEFLPFATDGQCKAVFGDLASFAQAAAAVRHARETSSTSTLETRLEDREESSSAKLGPQSMRPAGMFCGSCKKYYLKELRCADCGCVFHWCCADYEHEPCDDPFSCSTGMCITLQHYCRLCLSRLSIAAERVLCQEHEYLELELYFSRPGCEWRWIPCYCDGYTMFSAAWVGLEEIQFVLSPFYCDIGTERDYLDSRKSAEFLSFVSSCASEALEIIALSLNLDQEREKWTRIRDNPSDAPKLQFAEFDLGWRAVCSYLKSNMSTCIRIWKYVAGGDLMLEKNYESEIDNFAPIQTIDVLMWNTKVATHFDLLLKPS